MTEKTTKDEVSIDLLENEIIAGQELHGIISIKYNGRFDSVVINSQIENSNDIFNYVTVNGKKMNYPYARLSMFKEDIQNNRNKLKFTAITTHKPAHGSTNGKFRVAIVQEHKEVATDLAFIKIKNQ
jgi:hypothetical protein